MEDFENNGQVYYSGVPSPEDTHYLRGQSGDHPGFSSPLVGMCESHNHWYSYRSISREVGYTGVDGVLTCLFLGTLHPLIRQGDGYQQTDKGQSQGLTRFIPHYPLLPVHLVRFLTVAYPAEGLEILQLRLSPFREGDDMVAGEPLQVW